MMNKDNWKNKKGPVILVSKEISYTFPLSYAYLAGFLRENKEKVEIIFKHSNYHKIVKEIINKKPLIVGFGNLYPELEEIRQIIKLLDEAGRQFPIVIGGQMVSPIPHFALQITGADFGVIGEGEITLYNLVKALRNSNDPTNVNGIAFKDGESVHTTGPGDIITDLTKLPKIPFDLFPESEWLRIGRWYAESKVSQPHWRFGDRVVNVHGGRGCPFKCNFCYHHDKPRYRPISNMMDEAKESIDRFKANFLYFSDDLVLASPKRARELVNSIRELKKPISYSVSARIDTLKRLDDDLLQDMKNTGCRIMGLGIESGSDRILNLIGKKCTSADIMSSLDRLNEVGILPTGNIMVGQQTETRDEVELSIEFMKESLRRNPNINYSFSITTPFPGSQLYNFILENEYLKNHQEFYDKYFSGSINIDWNQVVNLSAMKDEEVIEMYKKINREYHYTKRKVLNRKAKFYGFSKYAFSKTKKVLKKLPNSQMLLDVYDPLYSFVHKKLESADLRARNIK